MIRFDTLDKKPKLYNLLAYAALVLAGDLLIYFLGGEDKALRICTLNTGLCMLAIAELVIAFIKQLKYNPYSYNSIYYFGFALFFVYLFIEHIFLMNRIAASPDVYTWENTLHVLMNSAWSFTFWTSPFILLFSAALLVSNISLIKHEGKRFVNVLGMILSVLLVGGFGLMFLLNRSASGSQFEVMLYSLFTNVLAAVYLYFECMIIGIIVSALIVSRYEPDKDKDYMIVLGCGIRKDGTPTPLLKGRLDAALAFAKRQKAQTGKELVFVTSGGQGPTEIVPESTAMKNYLVAQGVPEELVIEEDKSASTFENMLYSKGWIVAAEAALKEAEQAEPASFAADLAEKTAAESAVEDITALSEGKKPRPLDPSVKVAFATTNYHVFRSGLYARRLKMRAVGIGAPTKWYFWPNAAVREFVGLLTEHKLKQALILGGLVVFYVVGTVLLYR